MISRKGKVFILKISTSRKIKNRPRRISRRGRLSDLRRRNLWLGYFFAFAFDPGLRPRGFGSCFTGPPNFLTKACISLAVT